MRMTASHESGRERRNESLARRCRMGGVLRRGGGLYLVQSREPMSYKVGDAVWAQSDGSRIPAGWHAAVVIDGPGIGIGILGTAYAVMVLGKREFLAHESWLRPRFDDGDSSARGSWDEVPWRPSVRQTEVTA